MTNKLTTEFDGLMLTPDEIAPMQSMVDSKATTQFIDWKGFEKKHGYKPTERQIEAVRELIGATVDIPIDFRLYPIAAAQNLVGLIGLEYFRGICDLMDDNDREERRRREPS